MCVSVCVDGFNMDVLVRVQFMFFAVFSRIFQTCSSFVFFFILVKIFHDLIVLFFFLLQFFHAF